MIALVSAHPETMFKLTARLYNERTCKQVTTCSSVVTYLAIVSLACACSMAVMPHQLQASSMTCWMTLGMGIQRLRHFHSSSLMSWGAATQLWGL